MVTESGARRRNVADDSLANPAEPSVRYGHARHHPLDPRQVLNLPADGNRYELVDGELIVSPSPGLRHQLVLAALFDALSPYVRALAWAVFSGRRPISNWSQGSSTSPTSSSCRRSHSNGGRTRRCPSS